MREILFRGKRKDNGEWIKEFYAHSGERVYILIDNDITVGYITMKEVIPETVGQYTGLKDCNVNKIFEGDIVRFDDDNGYITYGKDDAIFYLVFDTWDENFANIDSKDCEIIGNIYDNEHLIGE